MTTLHGHHPECEQYEHYEPTHLALFGGVAIVLLVFAWTFGAFVR
jgi:hypothetical protein